VGEGRQSSLYITGKHDTHIKGKYVSFYIAQYPVLRTAQNTFTH